MPTQQEIAAALHKGLKNPAFIGIRRIAEGERDCKAKNVKTLMFSLGYSIRAEVGNFTNTELAAAIGEIKVPFTRTPEDPDPEESIVLGRALAQKFVGNLDAMFPETEETN
jgi:hypothetical protein